jgi:hypothetical protein
MARRLAGRVGDEQEDMRDRRIVPPFQGNSPPHGLTVANPSLGLDGIPLAGEVEDAVPGS